MKTDPITWERLRAIFGYPKPVFDVTERQFDYFDAELHQLARTAYDKIDFGDLWYYHHDLAYVDLQPDLFAYLFPACLMDWHRTLLDNEACSHGDSEFHYGVVHGNVLEKMLSPKQREQVESAFRDSMLYRLNRERGFVSDGKQPTAYASMARLSSLGLVSHAVPSIFQSWWELESPGHAVAALQYCSALMYFDGENPLFDVWIEGRNVGCVLLWENDSHFLDRGWSEANVGFLRRFITLERVTQVIRNAADKLCDEPEGALARRVVADLGDRRELLHHRVAELPELLASANPERWTVS
ncbi:MAG: hypothetical protein DCC68_20530 [Planctomycetota bacterium]|nr:MAG: hypothetical protein DCC68_20530 [Planctomycetota bacterium]